MDSPVMEAVLPSTPQERVLNHTQEQSSVFPVPQIVEERVQNRTQEQFADSPVPRNMEAVVEVGRVTPQERVQQMYLVYHRSGCKIAPHTLEKCLPCVIKLARLTMWDSSRVSTSTTCLDLEM